MYIAGFPIFAMSSDKYTVYDIVRLLASFHKCSIHLTEDCIGIARMSQAPNELLDNVRPYIENSNLTLDNARQPMEKGKIIIRITEIN